MQGADPSSASATTADGLPKSSCQEDSTGQLGNILMLTVRENEKIPLTIEQIKSMPWTEYAKLWKDYVNHLAVCLVESNGNPESASSRRLETLVEEISLLSSCLATSNPRSYAMSRYCHVQVLQEYGQVLAQRQPSYIASPQTSLEGKGSALKWLVVG